MAKDRPGKLVTLAHSGKALLLPNTPPAVSAHCMQWLTHHGVKVPSMVNGPACRGQDRRRLCAACRRPSWQAGVPCCTWLELHCQLPAGGMVAGMHRRTCMRAAQVLLGTRVTKSADGSLFTDAGQALPADMTYWCTGGQPCTDFLRAQLGAHLDRDRFVRVRAGRPEWGSVVAAGGACRWHAAAALRVV